MDKKRAQILIFLLAHKKEALTQEIFAELKPFIHEGETVLNALSRLGGSGVDLTKYVTFDYSGLTGEKIS